MARTENAQVDVLIRTEEAQQRLRELKERMEELAVAMKKSSGAGKEERDAAKKEYLALKQEAQQLRDVLSNRVDIIINGETAGASINELEAASRKLYAEIKKLPEGSDEFIEKSQLWSKIKEKLDEVKASARGTNDELNRKVEFVMSGNITDASLDQLRTAAKMLNEQLDNLSPNTEEFVNVSKKLQSVEDRIEQVKKQAQGLNDAFGQRVQLIIDGNTAGATMEELDAAAKKLWLDLQKLSPSADEFVEKTKRFQEVEGRLKTLQSEVKGTGGLWASLTDEVKQFGAIAAGYLGFQFISGQVSNIIQKNAQLSDSLADIRRVANLSEQEVSKLNSQFQKFDTRTSTQQLREIAIIAGKLGVEKENIAGFTREVDKLVVTLGDELGNADQVTTQLGKILNVFEGKITPENISKLGNAIVQLANDGVATGGFISEFSQRISGVAVASNLSLAATTGLGAGLEELGAKVESSATAVQKLVITIAQDVTRAAKVAGATTKEEIEKFATTFAQKPQEALLQYAEGLTKNKKSFDDIAKSFKDAGEEGARVVSTLAQMGGKADFLREKMQLADQALQDTSAINEAFALKNENLGAALDKLGKKFYAFISSSSLRQFLAEQVSNISSFIDAMKGIPQWIDRNSSALIGLAGITALYYASVIRATVASTINTTVELANAAAKRVTALATALAEAATAAYVTVVNLLTGRISLATAAQRLFNIVFAANPVGLFIAVIAAAAVAIDLYSKNNAEAIRIEKEKFDLNKKLAESTESLKKSTDQYNEQIRQLNRLSPEQQQNLRNEIELKLKSTEATINSIKAKQLDIEQDSRKPSLWQSLTNAVTNYGSAHHFAMAQVASANKNAQDASNEFNEKIKELTDEKDRLAGTAKSLSAVLEAERNAMTINTVTIDNYNEKLSLLRTALNATEIGSESYVRILREIEKTQKELNSLSPPSVSDEYVNNTKKLLQQLEDVRISVLRDEEVREIESLNKKLERQKKEISDTEADVKIKHQLITALEEKHQQDIVRIHEKYRQERASAALDRDLEKTESMAVKERIVLQQRFEQNEIAEADYHAALYEINDQSYSGRIKLLDDFETSEKEVLKRRLENLEITEEQYASQSGKLDDKVFKLRLNAVKDFETQEKNILKQRLLANEITEEEYKNAVSAVEKNSYDQRLELYRKYGKDYSAEQAKQLDDDLKAQDDARKEAQRENRARLELDLLNQMEGTRAHLDAKIALIRAKGTEEAAAYAEGSYQRQLIEEQTNQAILDARKQHYESIAAEIEKYAGMELQALSLMNDFEKQRSDKSLSDYKKTNEQKKADLKKRFDTGIINEKEYQDGVEKLNTEYAAKEKRAKREAAERDKQMAILQSLVQNSVNVIRALGQPPVPNYGLAAITGAFGLAQVGLIAGKEVPAFQFGRKPVTGIIEGPSHAEEGIKLVDSKTGAVKGEMEGGEGIFSVAMYQNNRDVIDAIFEAGGRAVDRRKLPMYADGTLPADQQPALPGSLISITQFSQLRQLAFSAVSSEDIASYTRSIEAYRLYSNELIQLHRERMAVHNELDVIQQQAGIKGFEETAVKQRTAMRTVLLDNTETIINSISEKTEAAARQLLIRNQARIARRLNAALISDFDDGIISETEFNTAQRNLNTGLNRLNLNEDVKLIPKKQETVIHPIDRFIQIVDEIQNRSAIITNQQQEVLPPGSAPKTINPFSFEAEPPQINVQRIIESVRSESVINTITILKELGVAQPASLPTVNSQQAITVNAETGLQDNNENAELLRAVHQTLEQIRTRGVRGVWNHRDWKEGHDEIEQLKERAKFY